MNIKNTFLAPSTKLGVIDCNNSSRDKPSLKASFARINISSEYASGSILNKWTQKVTMHYNKADTKKEVSTHVH